MSILYPQIKRIGNRFYRQNPSRQQILNLAHDEKEQQPYLEEETHFKCEPDLTESDLDLGILEFTNPIHAVENKYSCTLRVPSYFHKFIIGRGRNTIDQLQASTNSSIRIPKSGTNVKIDAESSSMIIDVCNRISSIVTSARQRADPSHFLSLSVNCKKMQQNYNSFCEQILVEAQNDKTEKFANIDESLFMPLLATHITISTMFLADQVEVETAVKILKDFMKSEAGKTKLTGGCLNLSIKGLEIMNDDLTDVKILYGKIANEGDYDRFQNITNSLNELMYHNSLHCGYYRPDVKLHLTLMNATRRAKKLMNQNDKPKTLNKHQMSKLMEKYMTSFNAEGIMNQFGSFTFLEEHNFNEISFAIRNATVDLVTHYPYVGQILLKDSKEEPAKFVYSEQFV